MKFHLWSFVATALVSVFIANKFYGIQVFSLEMLVIAGFAIGTICSLTALNARAALPVNPRLPIWLVAAMYLAYSFLGRYMTTMGLMEFSTLVMNAIGSGVLTGVVVGLVQAAITWRETKRRPLRRYKL